MNKPETVVALLEENLRLKERLKHARNFNLEVLLKEALVRNNAKISLLK